VDEGGLWPDAIHELKPVRPDGAEVVWSWHAWDHLVQDHDRALPSHGEPSANPGRIDINIGAAALERAETDEERVARLAEAEQLRALGYLGGDDSDEGDAAPAGGGERGGADWMHTNGISYSPELDLIAISVRNFSETS
jgi:hypothetical protein